MNFNDFFHNTNYNIFIKNNSGQLIQLFLIKNYDIKQYIGTYRGIESDMYNGYSFNLSSKPSKQFISNFTTLCDKTKIIITSQNLLIKFITFEKLCDIFFFYRFNKLPDNIDDDEQETDDDFYVHETDYDDFDDPHNYLNFNSRKKNFINKYNQLVLYNDNYNEFIEIF